MTLQAPYFTAGPIPLAKLGNRDERSGAGPPEQDRIPLGYPARRVRQIPLPDQSGPVDRYDTLRLRLGTRDHFDAVPSLWTANRPTLSRRVGADPACPSQLGPLTRAVVVPRNEPDVADDVQSLPSPSSSTTMPLPGLSMFSRATLTVSAPRRRRS